MIFSLVGLCAALTAALGTRHLLSRQVVAPSVPPRVATQSTPSDKIETCPAGFVLVPGNILYGTGAFCAMKYEAKCANVANPAVGIESASSTSCAGKSYGIGNGTYKNSGAECSCTGSREVVSTPSGYPITFIPLVGERGDNAKAYCAARGWHVMTNGEWMTIARDAEAVPANWCDKNGENCGNPPGTAGKILANGHKSGTSALVAGPDSAPCFGTTKEADGSCTGSSEKRTITLSNGRVLWDLAGNVWEWVDMTVMRKDEPHSAVAGVVQTGWHTSDFAPGSSESVITDNGAGPSLGYDAFRPSNPAWNAGNGVGRIYHYSTPGADTSTAVYGVIRGGNWRHGWDDGLFNIHLSPPPDKTGIDDVGFRCTAPVELR